MELKSFNKQRDELKGSKEEQIKAFGYLTQYQIPVIFLTDGLDFPVVYTAMRVTPMEKGFTG